MPVEDLADLSSAAADGAPSASIWPHVEKRIVDLIEAHRSTIVFANSRRLAERLTARLNEIHAERHPTARGPGRQGPTRRRRAARGRHVPASGPPAQLMAQSGLTQLGRPRSWPEPITDR